jgi:uncharacterized membrane protein
VAPYLLAHADGFSWDEALLVMAPLVIIGGLLWIANRRASHLQDEEATADEDEVTVDQPG